MRTTLTHFRPPAGGTTVPRRRGMILLAIAGAWLAILVLVLGMLRGATGAPTPRHASSSRPATVAHDQTTVAGRDSSAVALRPPVRVSTQMA